MYTYLAYDGRYYKIGESKDPEKRIKSMQTANPSLRLLNFSDKVTEKQLHKLFFSKRYKREFFSLDKNEVEKIHRLMKGTIGVSDKWYLKKWSKSNKPRHGDHVLKFGKYKGKKIREVPTSYLKYILANYKLFGDTKMAISRYLEKLK